MPLDASGSLRTFQILSVIVFSRFLYFFPYLMSRTPKRGIFLLVFHFFDQLHFRDFFARSGALLALVDSEYISIS